MTSIGRIWRINQCFGLVAVGVLSAISASVAANPSNITVSVSAGQLTLSWPADQGWRLQCQTNAPGVGLSANWVDVPEPDATDRLVVTMNPANGSVFYRAVLIAETPVDEDVLRVGTITHYAIEESSGLAASRTYPGVVWTHNDSGTPFVLSCMRRSFRRG
ncbi:MAG: hypothetical protein L0Y58_08815 [Verrucomicrobia subdivision 3 bacterium]|nr:hypothetical protein [Limisphaerales bacterium]